MAQDAFFDDEEELIAQEEKPEADLAKPASQPTKNAPASQDSDKDGAPRKAGGPSFVVVVLIAVVALLLGYVLGYLNGSIVGQKRAEQAIMEDMRQRMQQQPGIHGNPEMGGGSSVPGLPPGHPDVSDKLDKDGNPLPEDQNKE